MRLNRQTGRHGMSPRTLTALLFPALLGACAQYGPSKAAYTPVDPAIYADWSCAAIASELDYVLTRFRKLDSRLGVRNGIDVAAAGGAIVLPPLVAFVDFTVTSEDENYSRLAAHAVALSKAGRSRGCPDIPEVNIEEPKS